MTLAHQAHDKLWQEQVYRLVELGIEEDKAREMVGWAVKRGYEFNRIGLAIGELALKPPSPGKAWAHWRTALK